MKLRHLFVVMLLPAIATAQESAFTFRPAHWVDSETIQPTFYVSPLYRLAFPSPDEGWIAGERYVLHIQGDRLEVAFVGIGHSVSSFAFSSPSMGWAGAEDEVSGPMLRYRGGSWTAEPTTGIPWPFWGVDHVMAGRSGEAIATTWRSDQPISGDVRQKRGRGLLRYDGERWTTEETLLADGMLLTDACQTPGRDWWFVGIDTTAPSGRQMFLSRLKDGRLEPVSLPGSASERSSLYDVDCLPDGTAWAMGDRRPSKDKRRELLLLRFDGNWRPLAVPDVFPREPELQAFASASADEVWLSASCGLEPECCERFLHYRAGVWETVNLPLMPGGRCTKVSLSDMQFVSPDEGWAVGSDMEPRLGAGRIFHYKNGTWRLRNWNWHFWDAPWFNLFG